MLKTLQAHHTAFNEIANHILNKTKLVAGDNSYRICEIEFYYFGEEHQDSYTHCSNEQESKCKFYFHRYKNGTYKAGTYKCLDITMGEKNIYFGILIRSIMNIETKEFIEGPCRSLTEILKQFGCKEVKEFCDEKDLPLKIYDKKNNLYLEDLEENNLHKEQIYHGPRIGLSNKYPDWQNKHYRYAILIKNIKKQRKAFVAI